MRGTPASGTPELGAGDVVGPYVLEAALGEGAMGIVFRATREPDGQTVALKILKTALSGDELYRQRFLREARAASEVQHTHLVPILEAGEADSYQYLAVAYVNGISLADRIEAEGPLPITDCVQLAAEIGAGLDALHGAGVVHRDVKPSNIMLDKAGSAALTDFGLAKGRAYTVLTKPGQVMGTLDYLAPELIAGQPAEPATDVYALGCLMYECLTGGTPFSDRSFFEIAIAHLDEDPADPRERREGLSPELSWATMQALAKKPESRPPTATAYANILAVAARTSAS